MANAEDDYGGTAANLADQPTATVTLTNPISNVAGQSSSSFPPDTVGDVGRNHYIQMVNATDFQIFDKNLNPLSASTNFASLWSSGSCSSSALGDPIVVYDNLADRWVLEQFNSSLSGLCLAISRTGTPTTNGADWFLYEVLTSVTPDYPKLGVWPTAYLMTTFEGADLGVYALDRGRLLTGNGGVTSITCAASGSECLKTTIPALGTATARSTRILPVDLDGPAPPPGTPGMFLRTVDGQQDPSNPTDRLELYTAAVDFTPPQAMALTLASTLTPNAFDIMLCNRNGDGVRDCIPQPGGADTLDSLSSRPMMQLKYRNFGTSQAMVFNQTVNVASLFPGIATHELAGIRWYQLQNTGAGWAIQQQGDYSPQGSPKNDDQLIHRWMGSAAIDRNGNLAVGYSAVNSDDANPVFPDIRYSGRAAGSPAGTLDPAEKTILSATGPEATVNHRWGDYSDMAVDPVDDCTFYYTAHSSLVNGTHPTRIASFRFSDCVPPTPQVCLLGTSQLTVLDRSRVSGPTAAGSAGMTVNSQASIAGNAFVNGNVLLNASTINGNLNLAGSLTRQNGGVVNGTVTVGPVALPSLVTYAFPVGTGTQQLNGTLTLTPGNYGAVTVLSRSRINLLAGTYNFVSLTTQPDVAFVASGAATINVRDGLSLADRTTLDASTPVSMLVTGSSIAIGNDSRLSALVTAPNATTQVNSRTTINGCIGSRVLTLLPDVILNSGGRTLPTN